MLTFWETTLAIALGTSLGIAVTNGFIQPVYSLALEAWRQRRARKGHAARMAELALMHTENLNRIESLFEQELAREGLTDEEREHITTHRNMAKHGAEMSYHLSCKFERQAAGIEGEDE